MDPQTKVLLIKTHPIKAPHQGRTNFSANISLKITNEKNTHQYHSFLFKLTFVPMRGFEVIA